MSEGLPEPAWRLKRWRYPRKPAYCLSMAHGVNACAKVVDMNVDRACVLFRGEFVARSQDKNYLNVVVGHCLRKRPVVVFSEGCGCVV